MVQPEQSLPPMDASHSVMPPKTKPPITTETISPYRDVLNHIGEKIRGAIHGGLPLTGSFQEFNYSVLVRGHHATAGITEITRADGNQFSCVLRSPITDAQTYLQLSDIYPLVEEYVPGLYGFEGDYAVLQRLTGLENETLQKRLFDKDYLHRYVNNVYSLIERTAQSGLLISDASFISGRNVMVDPETAEIQFVEQTALQPEENANVNELMGHQLLRELEGVDLRNSYAVQIDDKRMEFAYQLLQIASQKIKLAHLYRTNSYFMYNDKLSPQLIKSVEQNDYDAFQKLVSGDRNNYLQDITESSDPGYFQPKPLF